jgi:hypothetical protein
MIHIRGQLAIYSEYNERTPLSAAPARAACGFHMLSVKSDSTLFFKFAEGSMQQVEVIWITPATRKRPMSRPTSFCCLGTFYPPLGFASE